MATCWFCQKDRKTTSIRITVTEARIDEDVELCAECLAVAEKKIAEDKANEIR